MIPSVSCIIGTHELSIQLVETLASVISSRGVGWELIVVFNGLCRKRYQEAVAVLRKQLPCIRLEYLEKPGLTGALIKGCSLAKGRAIARLDVGDVMTPSRLDRQFQVLKQHPGCVLVTSDVEVCGPFWEPLQVKRCPFPMQQPQRADTLSAEAGLSIDIPHHASVMVRRSAYALVGGYRNEFYYGQDWDLWYRLAEQGSFFQIPEVLTRVRLFPCGLSSRHWREQRAIAALSRACYAARRSGHPEAPLLVQAARVRPRPPGWRLPSWWPFDRHQAEGAYFIAESLRRNGDPRCRRYFAEAFRHGPWLPKIWLRTAQSLHLSAHP